MHNVHPDEIDLARLAELHDGEADMSEHLRWCARCRSLVADYRWLQGEVAGTLGAVADAVRVPGSGWWAVREVLIAEQRRQGAVSRISAVASAVVAVCLMFCSPLPCIPSLLGAAPVPQAMRQTLAASVMSSPEAVVATAPAVDALSVGLSDSTLEATSTPAPVTSHRTGDVTPQPTPMCVLPPTPPQPDSLNL